MDIVKRICTFCIKGVILGVLFMNRIKKINVIIFFGLIALFLNVILINNNSIRTEAEGLTIDLLDGSDPLDLEELASDDDFYCDFPAGINGVQQNMELITIFGHHIVDVSANHYYFSSIVGYSLTMGEVNEELSSNCKTLTLNEGFYHLTSTDGTFYNIIIFDPVMYFNGQTYHHSELTIPNFEYVGKYTNLPNKLTLDTIPSTVQVPIIEAGNSNSGTFKYECNDLTIFNEDSSKRFNVKSDSTVSISEANLYYVFMNYTIEYPYGTVYSGFRFKITVEDQTGKIKVDDTVYDSSSSVIKIDKKTANVSVNGNTNAVINGYNRNNQYQTFSLSAGNKIELAEGLWNIEVSYSDTTACYVLAIFVPRLKTVYNNVIQYIDLYNSNDLLLPYGTEIIMEYITIGTTSFSMVFYPDGCLATEGEVAVYGFAENPNYFTIDEAYNKGYTASLQWGMDFVIEGIKDAGYFGTYEFEIEGFYLEEELCDIVVNKSIITFDNFNYDSIKSIYNEGSVTYFIGRTSNYDNNLDLAFDNYGVKKTFDEFFYYPIVSPQGLVGEVQLYVKISKENCMSLYLKTETINLSTESENITLNLHQGLSKNEKEEEKALMLSSSNILNHYNEIKPNYLLFVSMIFISAILALEIIIIKKHQKAHN